MASKIFGFQQPENLKAQNLGFLGFFIFGEILYRSYLMSFAGIKLCVRHGIIQFRDREQLSPFTI